MIRRFFSPMVASLFLLTGSFANSAENPSEKITGRFVFDRATTDPLIGTPFIYESLTGQMTELKPHGFAPAWSLNGSMVATSDPDNELILIFDDKGQVLKQIEANVDAQFFQWSSDGKLFFVSSEIKVKKIPDLYHIMSYDLKTDRIETIWTAELNKEIYHLRISPDGKTLACNLFFPANVKEGFDGYLAILNLETMGVKQAYPMSNPVGWYPGGKYLLIDTNKNKEGQWMNTPMGVLAKLNIETGEFQILHQKVADYQGTRLSKDGRFIVYSRAVKSGGKAIFVRSMETFEETQITQPIRMSNRIFSRDTNPDWTN